MTRILFILRLCEVRVRKLPKEQNNQTCKSLLCCLYYVRRQRDTTMGGHAPSSARRGNYLVDIWYPWYDVDTLSSLI